MKWVKNKMSIANDDLDLMHDPLYKALGFESPNDLSVEIANRILKAGKDALTLAGIARDIRKQRFIRVCFKCKKYESGDEWIDGRIPTGIESRNGFCPSCFKSLLGTQNSLFNSVTKGHLK